MVQGSRVQGCQAAAAQPSRGFTVIFILILFGFHAVAQDFNKIAPKTIEPREGEVEVTPETPAAADDEKILVARLTGLVFVNRPDHVKPRKAVLKFEPGRRYFFTPPPDVPFMWYYATGPMRIFDPNGNEVVSEAVREGLYRYSVQGKPGRWAFERGPDQILHLGIEARELDAPNKTRFLEKMRVYLGKSVSLKSLNELTREIIQFYRENDRPVVDVSVPEQNITSGVVQVVVLDGRLGEVKTEGNRWFDSHRLKSQVSLREGDVIRAKQLTRDLAWLNSNPFRQVNAVFTPGAEHGQTDMILKANDRFPVRFYGGYEDSGNDLTGDERLQMGFNWGDAFFLDQQMSYQFTGDPHFNKLTAHSGSYVIPLPWRHRLTFFGSYVETQADIANPLFDLKGKSWQASARYGVPLPAWDVYTHEWTAGFDFKQSNNNLEFGGAQVFNTTTEIAQWIFEYNSRLPDEWGGTSFGASLTFGPGGWTDRNKDLAFEGARRSALAEYQYGRFNLERVTKLPWDFTWSVKGSCQLSDGNLLGSEQLGLGGYSSVRGYDEREANGDEGYLVSTEIRTPSVSLGNTCGNEKAIDRLQVIGFVDYGGTENRILLPAEDPHLQLASVGPGVRYLINPYLTLRFDYGWQLYRTGLNPRYDSRGHLGVMLAY